MKRFMLSVAAGATVWCAGASAEGGRGSPIPAPEAASPTARGGGLDELLAARAKAAQRRQSAARRVGGTKEDAPVPAARAVPGGPSATPVPAARADSAHDRIVRTALTQQALAAQNALLAAKRAELRRWDAPVQAKFLRAFGTTDAATRDRVIARLDSLIGRNLAAMAAIADGINLQAFLESRKLR